MRFLRQNTMKRFKSEVTLNDDKSIATVTYKFRGLAEAEAFQRLVNQVISLSKDFIDESNEMDRFCKENNCEDF